MGRFVTWVTLTAVWVVAATAFGQSEPFTYQGQLKQQGIPFTGEVDLRFTLYDSDTADTPVAGPLVFDGQSANAAVGVVNGLFTVELDFGMDAIRQGGRWIQIEVRAPHDPSDSAPYTALTPRQRITAAPLALSVPGLASTPAGGVEVAGDIHTPGEVIASAFSSNSPLIFKVNPANVECARFDDANCFFGLGTALPQARLHIGGTPGVDGIMFPDGSLQTSAAGTGGGGGFWSASGLNIYNNNGGNVGIGTSGPAGRLEVVSATAGTGDNTARFRAPTIGPNASHLHYGTTGDWYIRSASALGKVVIQDTGGNVGIGSANPASKLEIVAQDALSMIGFQPFLTFRDSNAGFARSRIQGVNGDIVQMSEAYIASGGANPGGGLIVLKNLTGNVGIGSANPASKLEIVAQDALSMIGFQPFLTFRDSNAGFARSRIQGVNGDIVLMTEAFIASGGASPGAGLVLVKNGSGNVGIGTATPTSKLEIAAQNGLAITGFQPFLTLRDTNAGGARSIIASGNGDFGFYPNSFIGGSPAVVIKNGTGDVTVSGDMSCKVLTVRGADVAEKFPSNEENVAPGTVMEIDPDQPGKLRIAREAYSTRVAGVVSGAGDNPAGAVLGNFPGSENAPAIALSGRVWVRCHAGSTSIQPGDLLTSSEIPGHAMKASDREKSYGAIIGKAMSTLARGERGLVLVLVSLQ